MRRLINNKISIMLIIIIAIFTIFSYLFDQLVIREEDNYRTTQIKFENLNTKLSTLNSISTQLTNAYDTSS
jgi:CHASE3 domain sensor protein